MTNPVVSRDEFTLHREHTEKAIDEINKNVGAMSSAVQELSKDVGKSLLVKEDYDRAQKHTHKRISELKEETHEAIKELRDEVDDLQSDRDKRAGVKSFIIMGISIVCAIVGAVIATIQLINAQEAIKEDKPIIHSSKKIKQ